MQKISVKIKKDGSIEYGVEGVKGGSCKDITKVIDQISGGVISSEITGEFCEPELENTSYEGETY